MKYRRTFAPGGTFFFTLVTYQRRKIFTSPDPIELLRDAFRYTMEHNPFTIVASVILPEHMHFIWKLPPEDGDYSTRWRLVKSDFTRHWDPKSAGWVEGDSTTLTASKNFPETQYSSSRIQKGEKEVWQRRFWEHLIRDETDLSRHVEYIHYNPVKHGLVTSPWEWEYSSFRKYVKDGIYPSDWAEQVGALSGEKWLE